eukprot:CAMPEP_0197651864 /NCGR_PEP_ID=MMETSP1338-20131121/34101_1 /TAXON_ID=43686 ORGANISM="Pelagodinium beii, Strain RCC1491" /NCGR_SAMPLE_ID=MMETSP1338 /ASSEMBLY_ACC=CAM_ASM_000754 /LENGTH=348 /DNA_ID=CAMNT_0043226617 /DNA_START=59 /DNA_END=1105 /DNA_ORIENTATION=+
MKAKLVFSTVAALLQTTYCASQGSLLKVQEDIVKSLIAKKSKALTPEQKELIESVKAVITDTAIPDIMSAQQEDVKRLEEHTAAFDDCAAHFVEMEAEVMTLIDRMKLSRTTSNTCYNEKSVLDDQFESESTGLETYLSMQSPPSPQLPLTSMGTEVEMYIAELVAYFKSFNATYKDYKLQKSDTNKSCVEKSMECSAKNADYESAYCIMLDEVNAVKGHDAECYSITWTLYEETWTSAVANAASRKSDYGIAMQLLCFIDALLEEDTLASLQKLHGCETTTPDTDFLDMVAPDLPDPSTDSIDTLMAAVDVHIDLKVHCAASEEGRYDGESAYDESPYDESPYESPY